MARTRRFFAVMAVAAMPLAACANQDASHDDVVEALTDAGASDDQADCVANEFDSLSQDQLNDIAEADDLDDLGDDLNSTTRSVLDQCLGSDGSADTSDSTEATTTTTEG